MKKNSWANDMMDWLIYGKGTIPNLGDYLPKVQSPIIGTLNENEVDKRELCKACGKKITPGTYNGAEVEYGHDSDCSYVDIGR